MSADRGRVDGVSAGRWRVVVALVWVASVVVIFDRYAYQIEELNSRVRLFVMTGATSLRTFDERGLPTSNSARSDESFVSPFYVVHYGLIYSEEVPGRRQMQGFHWREDSSTALWNVPPPFSSVEYFRHCVDWLVDELTVSSGRTHLLYRFDWPYPNYPGGRLNAPWWSGLTDGYAIVLLLRAHETFGEERYLRAAQRLYESVIAPVEEGGSLITLNGRPWIEEYVDPGVDPQRLSFVLNGMIYATYGVDALERYVDGEARLAPALYASIAESLEEFDLGGWSFYDRIGTPANLKYHRIHVALLEDLARLTGDARFETYRSRWQRGVAHPGWYWTVHGGFSVSKLQFIVTLLLVAAIGPLMAVSFASRSRAGVQVASLPDEGLR